MAGKPWLNGVHLLVGLSLVVGCFSPSARSHPYVHSLGEFPELVCEYGRKAKHPELPGASAYCALTEDEKSAYLLSRWEYLGRWGIAVWSLTTNPRDGKPRTSPLGGPAGVHALLDVLSEQPGNLNDTRIFTHLAYLIAVHLHEIKPICDADARAPACQAPWVQRARRMLSDGVQPSFWQEMRWYRESTPSKRRELRLDDLRLAVVGANRVLMDPKDYLTYLEALQAKLDSASTDWWRRSINQRVEGQRQLLLEF